MADHIPPGGSLRPQDRGDESFTVLDLSHSPSHAPKPPLMRSRSKPLEPIFRDSPATITNGLQLKLHGKKDPFFMCTYALTPLMDKCVAVDWKIVVNDDVQSQHIRCHELQTGDELSMLVSNFKDQHAKAVILINTQDDYFVDPQFLEGMEKSSFPIVVVARSDGVSLLNHLDQHGDTLYARLDAESNVDVVLDTSALRSIGGKTSPHAAKKSEKEGPGLRHRVKAALGLKTQDTLSVDLKKEFQKLMYDADRRPVSISEDPAKFTMMMATMSNYEKEAKDDSNHPDVNEALKKMKPHMDEQFYEDIPFYLILAFRLHIRFTLYQCDELKTLVPQWVEKIENIKYKQLASIFNEFLKRGDFEVMCGITKEEESVSLFWYMESACLELSELSVRIKHHAQQGQNGSKLLPSRFCYSRMMWLTLVLKLHSERTQTTRSSHSVWYDRFIKYHSQIVMTDGTLRDIVDGLFFGEFLQLPKELAFSVHHMCNLFVSETCLRPFKHLRSFARLMEVFLKSEDEVYTLLTQIRAIYTSKMKEKSFTFESVSIKGTLADTISEGLSFLEVLLVIWEKRSFSSAALDSECVNWLQLFLEIVDITGDHPDQLLSKFFDRKLQVGKKYRKKITKQIMDTTKRNFDNLSIQQFFSLYKAFKIWPNKFLEEYLNNYQVPAGAKINDGTYKEFFGEVVDRFPEAHEHYYLLDLLIKISERYNADGCSGDFVYDLVKLGVPKLFATPDSSESLHLEQAREIRTRFQKLLRNYIRSNALKTTILMQITGILNAISSDRDEFQQLILGVLHQEIIPEFKALQELESNTGATGKNFRAVLMYSIDYLRKDMGWLQALSAKQTFCWGLINSCSSRIYVSPDNFDWLHKYRFIVGEIGKIFNAYCVSKKLTEKDSVLGASLPADIQVSPSEDVKKYFEWILSVQSAIGKWKKQFDQEAVNFDEILHYASIHLELLKICNTLACNSLLVALDTTTSHKSTFYSSFEMLNVHLIKYIPQNPDAKWCSFIVLLREYGVSLPSDIIEPIEKYIVFPDAVGDPDSLLSTLPPAGTGGFFQPGSDISLRLNKELTLKKLSSLVHSLDDFQHPLLPYVDMLIFFHLSHSVMFDKYLKTEIQEVLDGETEDPSFELGGPNFLSMFKFSASPLLVPTPKIKNELTVKCLAEALENTTQLLRKITKGEAAYADISANGKLDLEQLNIEKEFESLKEYSIRIAHVNFEGLDGVRSLLELFQYVKHVHNISEVCEQYQLKGCINDPDLSEVKTLVGGLDSEDHRAKLTSNEAGEKMKRIKELLCIHSSKASKCLEIFPAVAHSNEFFVFIRDKQFYTDKGQATFRQQYQLITAQLQHEEYNETVLNHLLAAFKVIMPFMNSEQSFKELMEKVTTLDTVVDLKQLDTVNDNITLIRLWFSRAEGDTLQNVANQLDKITETGYYSFKLHHEGEAQMVLEYTASSSQGGTSLEESGEALPSRPKSDLRSGDLEAMTRPKQEQWNSEQIRDFVRKLGFMDTEREGGDKIKHFRHISSIAQRLLELYNQLKDLGNPLYFNHHVDPLPCCIDRLNADARVKETEVTLESWRKRVSELRSQYDWLLFFSIPKILCLYKLLCSDCNEDTVDQIVAEISFLCVNDPTSRDINKGRIKTILDRKEVYEDKPPIYVVGQFLAILFGNHSLPRRADVATTPLLKARSLSKFSLSHDFTQLLYYCPNYTQGELIQTVIGICQGVPEAFEVFRCHPTTTEGELSLFIKRAARHSLRSIVLEVNKLPFKLQEGLMQLHLLVQATQGSGEEAADEMNTLAAARASPCIHFIETEPSVLRDVPWIQLKEFKEPSISFEDAQKICQKRVVKPEDFGCIQLVVGAAGDGKTHYIKEQLMRSPAQLTIAVNEAFTPLKAINRLSTIPHNTKRAAIFFNFTMLPPGDSVDSSECERYKNLMEVIGWFFFDLFVLGYVEDAASGKSFRFPGGLQWGIYIEVPSRSEGMSSGESFKLFGGEVPSLGLLGTQHWVRSEKPYSINSEVQLVCKYLQAYEKEGLKGIDRLYRDGGKLVKFSQEPDLSNEQCQELLNKYMPQHIQSTKITQRLFVKYMKRRCEFLDNLPSFNYNSGGGEYAVDEHGNRFLTNTQQLGSTLMRTMLREVSDFCDPSIAENWSTQPHQQLIYDYKDMGASFGLISLHPEKLLESEKIFFKKIGIKIPSMADLFSRKVLDGLLSRALNIQLENGRLTAIDDSAYVLTLDYTIKMLNIHERYECGVPVIIEGETGVGKTALIEMLSKLWNQSLLLEWKKQRDRVVEFFVRKMSVIPADVSENYQACVTAVGNMSAGQYVNEETLCYLCKLPDGSHGQLYTEVQSYINPMRNNPVVAQLSLEGTQHKETVTLEHLFINADQEKTPEDTARLLHAILCAQIKPTFHKINVHAAMTPSDIAAHLKPVFDQATQLRNAYNKSKDRAEGKTESVEESDFVSVTRRPSLAKRSVLQSVAVALTAPVMGLPQAEEKQEELFKHKMPFVTVFLDEVNTSSCVGLFKEIIVDRTFDGEPIPENVFIVAACNPHRGNSMASLGGGYEKDKEKWVRGTYYVRKLHPTLRFLMWDYGSLDEHQEKEYINAKMKMLNKTMSNPEIASLTDLIVGSQVRMRQFAYEQIKASARGMSVSIIDKFSKISSRSCVSQRDIQRVFTLYQWFIKIYSKLRPHESPEGSDPPDYSRRAVLVALGIVYYMRLNNNYRKQYSEFLDQEYRLPHEVTFSRAFEDELNWYIDRVELPKGIARTRALKENIFATIVCTVNHIPLIIVGAPGSSKTLSFNQTIANLKGAESRVKLFRDTSIFHSLDPHYYQCSRRTTSNEIQTVFSRAINRQRSHTQFKLPIYCVVFMDEAGLPEESHESLKVLHYHLDKQEVSFVAITNHVLDAAKTNRAVSLFRPEATDEDLQTLAKGCFCSDPSDPPSELKHDLEKVVKFCYPYSTLMESKGFARFFGLRDFIQFVNYLRRARDNNQAISSQVVMQALERNFNGSEDFQKICAKFLGDRASTVKRRGILEILRASLQDRPQDKQDLSENEVRYKLIIDPSEDDSLVRLLFTFGILKRDNTRIFVCSNFPADGQLQKINTIAAIRHSAIEGHTVVMSQTDDIHESFYDLFNQRFRRIDDVKEGPRYYTNIAIGAHLRPSRVHPNFQCVVVVKKSEVNNTPSPFLNRFEKYLITHKTMLDTALNGMPPSMASIIRAAMSQVQDFIDHVGGADSLYGLCPDTLNSLVLSLLPTVDHSYQELGELSLVDDSRNLKFYILQEIVQALRECTGLFIPKYTEAEFSLDVESVFELVLLDPKFQGLMTNLTHATAAQAIPEAMNILHCDIAPDQGQHVDVSPEGCLVIALLQQWLVRHFCKRLTQLMTSEAFILHRNKIPFSYLKNYLNFHTHFSLLSLVEQYHQAVDSTASDPLTCRSATKVLCFTRSSPLINQLPAEFPSSALGVKREARARQVLKDFVFIETDKLMTYKLSSSLSQTAVQEYITRFLNSDMAEICLLIVNMQETSKEIVNHVRIMIEEAESITPTQVPKLFVVLLNFPPSQFYKPCYRSLFLKGWDHCYLDTIAHSAVKGVVDIRDWFWQCCFPGSQTIQPEDDTLLQALHDILPQTIPALVSRVFFGSRLNSSFNSTMNGLQRTEALNDLLLKSGKDDITIGRIMCEKFRAYWKPAVMAEQLEKAALFSRNRESTLNITESIQTNFKSLFVDFLVYMISRINENYNIDILFDSDCSNTVQYLFLEIMQVFPTAKLSQVTLLSNNLLQPKPLVYTPKFPFFKIVCEIMEKTVEASREEANVKLDILSEITSAPESSLDISVRSVMTPQNILATLQQAVTTRLSSKLEGTVSKQVLLLVADAMSKDVKLWERYFNDFVLHKLHLDSEDSAGGIAQQILHTFLAQLHQREALDRIIGLHTYLHVYQLDLAKMASVLRPLNKLQKLHTSMQATILSPSDISPSNKLLSIVQQTQHPFGSPEHLATFVVTTLFDALVGFLYPSEGSMTNVNENMIIWHNVFRDVMTLPNLKQYIYSALGASGQEMVTVEAKLNVMQTTFLTLQISHDLHQEQDLVMKAQVLFRTLFTRHFTETKQMQTDCPRLSAVAQVALEVVVSTTGMSLVGLSDNKEAARVLLEGLFAHFFSQERPSYHPEDITWFLELANSQSDWSQEQLDQNILSADLSGDLMDVPEESYLSIGLERIPEGAIGMNVFKLYLGKILGQFDARSSGGSDSGPLQLYYAFPRVEIGKVLVSDETLGKPGPFIPRFYSECSFIKMESNSNDCMQQPLAHLYFLTVLEHLMSRPYRLSGLAKMATSISKLCAQETVSDQNKAVLYIELQAVLQVVAQQLAVHLDPSEPEKFGEVVNIIRELNSFLDEPSTGGGECGGHGMVVALHLFKILKSSRKFTELFMNKYDSIIKGIHCLEPFHQQLKSRSESGAHLFPFMMPAAEGELAMLYNQVVKVMWGIHKGSSQVDALKNLAEECTHYSRRPRSSFGKPERPSRTIDRRDSFRMMVWLVTYYEYFNSNTPSQLLCNAIGSPVMASYFREEGYVRMIQCFLLPELMINRPEAPNVLRDDEAVLELTADGRQRPIRRRGNEMDPVFELFRPSHPEQQDQSDMDLRHSLANLVGVVLGSPIRSNHLWYHMFAPHELVNTYMTGFMYDAKISPDGLQYDCGVELTAQGEFGRSDYQKHAGRGTYTLHSLYLLLWTNFGAFTMSLLTQPDADTRLTGSIISDWQSIRHYCVSQLRTVWQHMRNNLSLSEEERTFFVNRCLKTFHEVVVYSPRDMLVPQELLQSGELVKDTVRGVFATREELDHYEQLWHCKIYQPSWTELQDKFTNYSSLWQNTLFAKLRNLEVHYPHYPSETEFIHRILSSGELSQHSEGGALRGLSQFAQGWRRLQAGGLLLPDLMELYRWLHTELSHLITYEKATAVSILRVVQLAAKRYGSPMGEYITALYERVKKGYNDYVEMIGGAIGAGACAALKQGNRIYTIADDVPLLHFLTDVEQEEQGNDWLFTVIADIVEAHNYTIENLYTVMHSQDQFHLSRLLPDQPAKVLPTEVTEKNCIVGTFTSLHGVNTLVQVIRSRYCPPVFRSSDNVTHGPNMSFSPLPTKTLPELQLRHLEEDLVRLFTAGKPLIESASSIRTLFKFKQTTSGDATVPDDVIRVTMDLEEMGFRLPNEYKKPLGPNLHKRLEYECHSCGYNNLIEIVTALRTVCGHLVKVILEDAHLVNDEEEDLHTLSLPQFMMSYVYEHLTDPQRVLAEIGITPNSLKHSQLACLIELPLTSVYSCFQLFVQWVDQGLYDFCNLPLALKSHLSEEDFLFFERELREKWTGSTRDFETEIWQLIDVLKHSESDINKRVNEQPSRTSIYDYLKKFLLIEETDLLPPLIPDTVLLHHYVHFRLALRRILIRVRAELASNESGEGNHWAEFVSDLWTVRLPHLREETFGDGGFIYDPATGRYGFEDESDYGSDDWLSDSESEDDGGFTVDLNDELFDDVGQGQVTHSYDLGQSTDEEASEPEQEDSLGFDKEASPKPKDQASDELLKSRFEQDPDFQKRIMSIAQSMLKEGDSLAQKARIYTPEAVGDFLSSIGLQEHREVFIQEKVGGDVLLDADQEFLNALGVESALHCAKIMVLFKRVLEGNSEPVVPLSSVTSFLKENNFEKYINKFTENGIDGDMIMGADQTLMKAVLKEIGIGVVDRVKIISKFKTFVNNEQ